MKIFEPIDQHKDLDKFEKEQLPLAEALAKAEGIYVKVKDERERAGLSNDDLDEARNLCWEQYADATNINKGPKDPQAYLEKMKEFEKNLPAAAAPLLLTGYGNPATKGPVSGPAAGTGRPGPSRDR